MPNPAPLTLEGLAATLDRHIEHTNRTFDRVDAQIAGLADHMDGLTLQVGNLGHRVDGLALRVDGLTGQVEGLVGLMREQGLRLTALAEQQAEQQVQIRQILHRLEQHDARFGEHNAHIRRILDLLQHRDGDSASGAQ